MLIAGLVLAAVAAAIHVLIFALESFKWTEPATRRIFGIPSEADALTMKQLAFNQGFYNLFLALATMLGIGFVIVGFTTAGLTLVFAGTGMMLAASLVLVLSDRSKASAALKQGLPPLLAIVVTAIAVAIG